MPSAQAHSFTKTEVPNLQTLQSEVSRLTNDAERGFIFRGYYAPNPDEDPLKALQRGVFLAPADVTQTFAANLHGLLGHEKERNVVEFVLPRSEAAVINRELFTSNVTETTLFPGLDGFSRSLWQSARYLGLENLHGLQSI